MAPQNQYIYSILGNLLTALEHWVFIFAKKVFLNVVLQYKERLKCLDSIIQLLSVFSSKGCLDGYTETASEQGNFDKLFQNH